jgi:hypothetical protein
LLFPVGEFIPPLQLTLYRFPVYTSFIFHGIALCIVFAGRNDESFLSSPSDKLSNQATSKDMGGTIKETDPTRYTAICADLKAGKSLAATQRDNLAGSESVSRIKEELIASGDLKDWKRRTAGRAAQIVGKLLEKLDREADTMKVRDIPLAAAVLIDKASQLSGSASTVIEHRHTIAEGMAGWVGNRQENAAQSSTKQANVVEINTKTESIDEIEARTPPGKD